MSGTDDLCIKMIANSKKLVEKRTKSTQSSKQSVQTYTDAISQLFTSSFLSHPLVQRYPEEFAAFLHAKSGAILASFEKTIVGKHE
jgi:hypothetical protein